MLSFPSVFQWCQGARRAFNGENDKRSLPCYALATASIYLRHSRLRAIRPRAHIRWRGLLKCRGRYVETRLNKGKAAVERYDWSRLNRLQLGRYAEYFAKMEFTLFGFDVYTTEVDDRGIDFVIRKGDDRYYDVQVKSSRGFNYIFFPKDKFSPRVNLLAAVVLFFNGQAPQLYLIPSTAWLEPNALLVDRDYEGKKSKPEWGLNLSKKNLPLLMTQFAFDEVVQKL